MRARVWRYYGKLQIHLLDMRDRKGWKALGYSSFEEYGSAELSYEKVYLYRLANAADVERSLELPIGNSAPESHLRPLAPLTDEERLKEQTVLQNTAREPGKP